MLLAGVVNRFCARLRAHEVGDGHIASTSYAAPQSSVKERAHTAERVT
jgi:hypothetical protein